MARLRGGRDGKTGKRRRMSKTVRESRKQAADVLTAALAKCRETDAARDMALAAF